MNDSKTEMKTWKIAIYFIAALIISGCSPGEEKIDANCGAGESETYQGKMYCLYRSGITEEGFSCPAEFAHAHEFAEGTVCASERELAGETRKHFREVMERWTTNPRDIGTPDFSAPDASDATADIDVRDVADMGVLPFSASVVVSDIKTLRFSWNLIEGATEHKILEDKKADGSFVEIITGIEAQVSEKDYSISLYQNTFSKYIVQSCNNMGCSDSDVLEIEEKINEGIGYFKTNNVANSSFGGGLVLSENGTVMVGRGAKIGGLDVVYVFEKRDGDWDQTATLKASNGEDSDGFGAAAISGDGTIIAIGAPLESSDGRGVNGGAGNNNLAPRSGAVYIFAKSAGIWTEVAYIKSSNSDAEDMFGTEVAISADGMTLAVSAPDEESASKTVNQGLDDNSSPDRGAVYVFKRTGNIWSQQSYLKDPGGLFGAGDYFGEQLAISGDGNTIASCSLDLMGIVSVFKRTGENWIVMREVARELINSTNDEFDQGLNDGFGISLALNFDGKMLVIGAPYESGGTGSNGDPEDNSASESGAAYIFTENAGQWTEQAYLKSSNSEAGDQFGTHVSMSYDGKYIAVSSSWEKSNATGVNGDQSDNSLVRGGAAYVFERSGATWTQISYLKATNTAEEHSFGVIGMSMSGDGKSLAVSGRDSSGATGINGDAFDTTRPYSSSVFLY